MTGPTTLLQYLFCQFWKQLKLSLLNQFWNKNLLKHFKNTTPVRKFALDFRWILQSNSVWTLLQTKAVKPPTLTKSFFRIVVNWLERRDVLIFGGMLWIKIRNSPPDKRKKRASENLMLFNKKKSHEESMLKINMIDQLRVITIQLIFWNLTVIVIENLFIFTHSILESN